MEVSHSNMALVMHEKLRKPFFTNSRNKTLRKILILELLGCYNPIHSYICSFKSCCLILSHIRTCFYAFCLLLLICCSIPFLLEGCISLGFSIYWWGIEYGFLDYNWQLLPSYPYQLAKGNFHHVNQCFSTSASSKCVDLNSQIPQSACWLGNSGRRSPHIPNLSRLRNTGLSPPGMTDCHLRPFFMQVLLCQFLELCLSV